MPRESCRSDDNGHGDRNVTSTSSGSMDEAPGPSRQLNDGNADAAEADGLITLSSDSDSIHGRISSNQSLASSNTREPDLLMPVYSPDLSSRPVAEPQARLTSFENMFPSSRREHPVKPAVAEAELVTLSDDDEEVEEYDSSDDIQILDGDSLSNTSSTSIPRAKIVGEVVMESQPLSSVPGCSKQLSQNARKLGNAIEVIDIPSDSDNEMESQEESFKQKNSPPKNNEVEILNITEKKEKLDISDNSTQTEDQFPAYQANSNQSQGNSMATSDGAAETSSQETIGFELNALAEKQPFLNDSETSRISQDNSSALNKGEELPDTQRCATVLPELCTHDAGPEEQNHSRSLPEAEVPSPIEDDNSILNKDTSPDAGYSNIADVDEALLQTSDDDGSMPEKENDKGIGPESKESLEIQSRSIQPKRKRNSYADLASAADENSSSGTEFVTQNPNKSQNSPPQKKQRSASSSMDNEVSIDTEEKNEDSISSFDFDSPDFLENATSSKKSTPKNFSLESESDPETDAKLNELSSKTELRKPQSQLCVTENKEDTTEDEISSQGASPIPDIPHVVSENSIASLNEDKDSITAPAADSANKQTKLPSSDLNLDSESDTEMEFTASLTPRELNQVKETSMARTSKTAGTDPGEMDSDEEEELNDKENCDDEEECDADAEFEDDEEEEECFPPPGVSVSSFIDEEKGKSTTQEQVDQIEAELRILKENIDKMEMEEYDLGSDEDTRRSRLERMKVDYIKSVKELVLIAARDNLKSTVRLEFPPSKLIRLPLNKAGSLFNPERELIVPCINNFLSQNNLRDLPVLGVFETFVRGRLVHLWKKPGRAPNKGLKQKEYSDLARELYMEIVERVTGGSGANLRSNRLERQVDQNTVKYMTEKIQAIDPAETDQALREALAKNDSIRQRSVDEAMGRLSHKLRANNYFEAYNSIQDARDEDDSDSSVHTDADAEPESMTSDSEELDENEASEKAAREKQALDEAVKNTPLGRIKDLLEKVLEEEYDEEEEDEFGQLEEDDDEEYLPQFIDDGPRYYPDDTTTDEELEPGQEPRPKVKVRSTPAEEVPETRPRIVVDLLSLFKRPGYYSSSESEDEDQETAVNQPEEPPSAKIPRIEGPGVETSSNPTT